MQKSKHRFNGTDEERDQSKAKLKELVKKVGMKRLGLIASIPEGTLKGILGSAGKLPSPLMVIKIITAIAKNKINLDGLEFTKEDLRPDLLPIEWDLIKKDYKESNKNAFK